MVSDNNRFIDSSFEIKELSVDKNERMSQLEKIKKRRNEIINGIDEKTNNSDDFIKYEKYLPIGTVVMLKGGFKRILITGFCCSSSDKKIYDYSGCLYPEGIISSTESLMFNHEQISQIYHLGYISDEEKKFKEVLKQALQNT